MVSANSEQLPDWLCDVGLALEFDNIKAPMQASFELPPYVPGVKYQAPHLSLPEHEVYAVSFDSVVTPSRAELTAHACNLREHIGIPATAKILWAPFETDRRLENFWANHRLLLPQMRNVTIDYTVSPNFSLYGDQPRMYHLLNMKRSLVLYAEFAKVGFLSIPHIYWWRPHDVERWAKWLDDNGQCNWVAVNLQTTHGGVAWDDMLSGLCMLAELSERRLNLLVAGVASRQKVADLSTVGWRISVTHQRAHFLAAQYRIIEEDETEIKVQGMSYESMLAHNIEVYSRIVSEALRE